MIQKHVDIAIIGTGTAGMGAYRAAREYTQNLVLIEGGKYGTTCARVGCMPSKLLISSAEVAHQAQHAQAFGIGIKQVTVDSKAVMARVRRERDRFVGFVLDSVDSFDTQHKLIGHATFKDDHTLIIDGYGEVRADRIVIATGSRPAYPPLLAEAGDLLLTSDTIFELETLPDSIGVFGPGVVGLELGQALSRLGVQVSVFGRSGSIAILRDPEIKDYAEKTFNEEFCLALHTTLTGIRKIGRKVEVSYINKAGAEIMDVFSYILAASGRRTNLDKLGLENTSLKLDKRGVPLFDYHSLQAQPGHIFIAGDATHSLTILHEASDEGRIAGDNAGRYPDVRKGLRRAPFSVVFTEPQIATIGLSIDQINTTYVVGRVSFEDQGRSRILGKNKGILKVYAEQNTGLFLGAEMFGPAAEHIGHLLSWAVQQKLTISQMLEMPFYHPVIEEAVRTALQDLNLKLRIPD